MAKIKPNNFLDTVDSVFNDAKKQGILHLYAEGDRFTGRHIRIGDKDLFHFGTTGYLGLEQDPRLKKAAVNAINRYRTQFPLSKTYISHPFEDQDAIILDQHNTADLFPIQGHYNLELPGVLENSSGNNELAPLKYNLPELNLLNCFSPT